MIGYFIFVNSLFIPVYISINITAKIKKKKDKKEQPKHTAFFPIILLLSLYGLFDVYS